MANKDFLIYRGNETCLLFWSGEKWSEDIGEAKRYPTFSAAWKERGVDLLPSEIQREDLL